MLGLLLLLFPLLQGQAIFMSNTSNCAPHCNGNITLPYNNFI